MAGILRIARQLAAAHPSAMLPCPVCAAAVRAAHLDAHLAKQHPGGEPATTWAGIRGGRLTADRGQLVLRRWAGLRRRTVDAPQRVTLGSVTRSRPDPTMTSYADDFNVPHVTDKVGSYLRVYGAGRRSIVIGCRSAAPVRKVWAGWTQGKRRRRRHIVLTDADFVALQYALAGLGVLRLRTPD